MSYTRTPLSRTVRTTSALVVCVTLGLSGLQARQSQVSLVTSSPFDSYLESLRAQSGIPGMSAALVQDGEIVWERGIRLPESGIAHPRDARYALPGAGHQPDACRGPRPAVRRTAPAGNRRRKSGGSAAVSDHMPRRQVLSHTSAGAPPASFRYDAERYSQLTPVVERCLPQPYRKSVAVNILERLAMKDSVPGATSPTRRLTEKLFADEVLERYQQVLSALRSRTRSTSGRGRRETNFPRKASTPRPGSSRPSATSPASTPRSMRRCC